MKPSARKKRSTTTAPAPAPAEEPEVPKDREVTVRTPADFVLPTFYETATPEEAAEALLLGASLYAMVKTATTNQTILEIEQKHEQEIVRLKAAREARIKELEEGIRVLDQERIAAQNEHALQKNKMLEAHREHELQARKEEREYSQTHAAARIKAIEAEFAAAQMRIQALQERKEILEAGRETDMKQAEERTKALLQHALDEKDRAIERTERMLHTLQEVHGKQSEELRSLSDLIRKKPTVDAKTKGTEYEEIFREKLVSVFGIGDRFSLEDSARSGIGHAGDYVMHWGDHTVLWEVKNYTNTVPIDQIDKFKRDMKDNTHVRVGVLISRKTPISGKTSKGDRDIEVMDGQLLIYLSSFESMGDEVLQGLMMLFRVWWESDRNIEDTESKENTIRMIERLHADAVKARTEWRLHKSYMEKTMHWMAERVDEVEGKLHNTLNVLQGAVVVDVPAGIFRESAGDDKAQELIQLILSCTVVDPDSSITLNDLADILSKKRAISRDTTKRIIASVLLDSVQETKPGKPTRLLGFAFRDAITHS